MDGQNEKETLCPLMHSHRSSLLGISIMSSHQQRDMNYGTPSQLADFGTAGLHNNFSALEQL